MDALPPAKVPVRVTMASGEHIDGTLKASEPDSLTLVSPAGNESRIPKSDVVRVVSQRQDSVRNGTLIGLAVGFAAGAGLGLAASESGGIDITTKIAVPVVGGLGAAVGALVGYLFDRGRHADGLLYRAP